MDEKQIQHALEQIAMNESLTDELADDEAELLLQWGESQVYRLADQIEEAEAFDESLHMLRKLMAGINGFIGLRGDMDATEQRDGLVKIAEAAQAMGYAAFSAEQVNDFLQHPISDDNCENMNLLTTWINAHDAAAHDAAAADEPAADEPAMDAIPVDDTASPADSAPDSPSSPADFSSDTDTIYS